MPIKRTGRRAASKAGRVLTESHGIRCSKTSSATGTGVDYLLPLYKEANTYSRLINEAIY